MIRLLRVLALGVFVLVVVSFGLPEDARAQIVNSEWNTGNGNWNVPTNWFPNAAPDNGGGFTFNVQIGNRPVAANAQVTFVPASGTSDTISTLTVSNGADFLTNGNQLNVLGATVIDGAGATIRVDPHATPGTAALTSLSLSLNNGGGLTMAGGIANVSGGQLEINAGSVLGGHGTLNVGDSDLVAEQTFDNSALLQPQGNTAAPQTLTIHATGLDTIDLDGDSEAGVVDVDNALANTNADTVTLVIDGPLADPFGGVGGTIQIGQRDTLTFTHDFTIAGAVATPVQVQMTGGNNVATLNGSGNITSIQNSTWTISGAARIDNNMTFTGTTNTITVPTASSLTLNGTVSIPDASALAMGGTAQLIIGGSTTISEAAGDFDWDGGGAVTTTVNGTGQLTLTANHIDVGNDVFDGTLNLNDDGDVSVNPAGASWTMSGTLNKNNAGTSTVSGKAMIVDGTVNVHAGTLSVGTSTFESAAHFNVDAGATASMSGTTLNAGAVVVDNGTISLGSASVLAGATISGTGLFRLNSTSSVTANTTINTTSFDWDGLGAGTLHTINDGVVFTINSTTWDPDDAGDMDDPINVGGNGGILAVNNVPSWTMTRTLTTNTSVLGITSLNGNSRMILSGATAIWNANGQTAVNVPVTFGASSTVNIAAAGFIRMNGGDAVSNFNRIEGATINGPGGLLSINTRELRGFGTINAPITFQNASSLRADDGTLTIGGAINEVSTIGTADDDGILNVTNAWNSNVAASVVLNGGELQGGAITVANANGIKGKGLVSARVVNNTRLEANVAAGTLVFETAANDNDWDGAGNIGLLAASGGGTLEVRDNATFAYGGTVTAAGASRVYAKGFGFTFGTTSAINLTASTLQTDETSSFSGPIVVGAGADSTINVQVNRFLDINSTSAVTLNGNLRLVSNNASIAAGATFSGPGAIIIPSGSHLVTDPGANINVLLDNEGTIRPSGFDVVGNTTIKDYQQTNTGQLFVELTGTLLNQYDRFTVTGVAQLDGYLNIDIDGAFVPALGNLFNIISAPGGVIGTFDNIDVSGMPAGLTFHVNYLPTLVQLQVVTTPFFSADFDHDGDVDSTDYAIWRGAYNLNQLGDANGDNISNARDYVLWRKQFGSHAGAGSGAGVASAVPEPGTTLLVLVAAACVPVRRARVTTPAPVPVPNRR